MNSGIAENVLKNDRQFQWMNNNSGVIKVESDWKNQRECYFDKNSPVV